ncbi:hypothetical protein AB5J49_39480 [Streptomyces sp. R28]|uniref:Uncharacterized protein n=1 Tax=Streptomyces sp. R28 TaxID=3238628 RepID=A0AB39QBP0_9ACTN
MEPQYGESVAERFGALAAMHLAEARAITPVAAMHDDFHAGKRDDGRAPDGLCGARHRRRPVTSTTPSPSPVPEVHERDGPCQAVSRSFPGRRRYGIWPRVPAAQQTWGGTGRG